MVTYPNSLRNALLILLGTTVKSNTPQYNTNTTLWSSFNFSFCRYDSLFFIIEVILGLYLYYTENMLMGRTQYHKHI